MFGLRWARLFPSGRVLVARSCWGARWPSPFTLSDRRVAASITSQPPAAPATCCRGRRHRRHRERRRRARAPLWHGGSDGLVLTTRWRRCARRPRSRRRWRASCCPSSNPPPGRSPTSACSSSRTRTCRSCADARWRPRVVPALAGAGHLAEAAAEAIGADSLLARVSGYYHDIGNSKMPDYFVENQAQGVNPHDHLDPSMSALVVAAHVKEGVEMARKTNCRSRSVTAITRAPRHEADPVLLLAGQREGGPRRARSPRSSTATRDRAVDAEIGILMLADAVEAARARSPSRRRPGSGR